MKRAPVIHPCLLAAFPILFFYSQNLGEFRLRSLYVPVLQVVALTAAVLAGLAFLTRNTRKSGLAISLFLVLFSSYGHVVDALKAAGLSVPVVGPAALVAPAYAAVLAVGLWRIYRTRSALTELTKILNLSAAVAVVFSLVQIALWQVRVGPSRNDLVLEADMVGELKAPRTPRNIYYIILDAYGRSDVLDELYGYDNSELIDFLRERSFYIASQARTNYSYTVFSLASSLNFDYPGNPGGRYEKTDWVPLKRLLARNAASRLLKKAGYRFIWMGGNPGEIENADMSMHPEAKSEFTAALLKTTAAASLTNHARRKRREILYPFEKLPETADMGSSVFVFAHIMSPHRPFVFAADGSDPHSWGHADSPPTNAINKTTGITRSQYIERYRQQAACIDKLVMKTIREILARSKVDPLIILQSDHGPAAYRDLERVEATYLKERMSILNAYHLPDGGDAALYDSITPVNTFRVIFNHYFGTNLALLEDRSYFSQGERIWQYVDVTDMIDTPEDRARLEMLKGTDYFPERESAPGRAVQAAPGGPADD